MKKLVAIIAAALVTVCVMALAGCGGGATTANLNFGSITLQGKTLTVALEANQTTGYEWTGTVEGAGIEATSDTYEEDAHDGDTTGVGGTHTFVYTGTGAGEATITLNYQRSWETTDDDLWLTITVATDGSGNITSYQADASDGGSASYKG
jgi:inhibitor of cysteine peptidase